MGDSVHNNGAQESRNARMARQTTAPEVGKMDTAPLVFQRDALSTKGQWPISERARWLPALAIAIGIIYGSEASRTDLLSGGPRPAE